MASPRIYIPCIRAPNAIRTLRGMKLKSLLILVSIALAACQPSETKTSSSAPAASGPITINGAGATFPNPIYSKWFDEYQKSHPDIRINYQSIGSGGGIKQLSAQTVFFGASDGPMTDAQLQSAPGAILHFPTVLGGVVPVYNVTGVTQALRFNGAVLADIYLGKITKWNDAAIAAINPGVKLPADDIVVVHRSEGSGRPTSSATSFRRFRRITNRRSACRPRSTGRWASARRGTKACPDWCARLPAPSATSS